jgi:hypothetical protein
MRTAPAAGVACDSYKRGKQDICASEYLSCLGWIFSLIFLSMIGPRVRFSFSKSIHLFTPSAISVAIFSPRLTPDDEHDAISAHALTLQYFDKMLSRLFVLKRVA